MSNNPEALIIQINKEWDLIFTPFILIEQQYLADLKNIILKYVSSPSTFGDVCNASWEDLYHSSASTLDYLGRKEMLENILYMHINHLEHADEQ